MALSQASGWHPPFRISLTKIAWPPLSMNSNINGLSRSLFGERILSRDESGSKSIDPVLCYLTMM